MATPQKPWDLQMSRFMVIQFTPDVTAPSVPGQPTQTGVTNTTASFNWTASTDTQSGVAGYNVERNGSIIATSATVTTNSFTDSGPLTPGSTYTYRVQAVDVAGLASGFSASRAITTTGGAGTADWIARSTAAGVVMAKNFSTSAQVTNFVHGDSMAGNVTRDTSEGLSGGAAMKFFIPGSAGDNPGQWRCPLNDAWTTNGQGFGIGEFYVQYRIKCGPNWLRPSNGGGGRKCMILSGYRFDSPNSSSSALSFEIVHNNQSWRGNINSYHQDGNGFPPFDETIGGNLRQQPAVDWGAGLPDQQRYAIWNNGSGFSGTSPGCVKWREGEWYTIYFRVKVHHYGGSAVTPTPGNEYDMYIAGPGDTSYTQLYSSRNFTLGDGITDPNYAGGFSGIWFTGFDTGRVNAPYDTWFWIGELICSTQPIACPTPVIAPATWSSTQIDKTWKQPVGNTISNVYTTTTAGTPSSSIMAYSGAWDFDVANKKLTAGYGAGHTDGDSNAVHEVALATNSPVWVQRRAPSVSQLRSGSDFTCAYSDGQPRAAHTFKHGVFIPGTGSFYIMTQAGLYQDGQNGGRIWELPKGSTTWVARGYRPGAGVTTGLSDTQCNGMSAYDPLTGQIFTLTANGAAWTFDPVTFATALKSNVNPINFTMSGDLAPELRCYLVYHPATGAIRNYNIDTDTYSTPTIVGTGPTSVGSVGLVWHASSRSWLAWGHTTNRERLYKLTPAASTTFSFTGTLTWSQVTPDAANAITPPNVGTYGNAQDLIHGKFAICKDFYGLRNDAIALTLRTDGPVSIYKLPKGGL